MSQREYNWYNSTLWKLLHLRIVEILFGILNAQPYLITLRWWESFLSTLICSTCLYCMCMCVQQNNKRKKKELKLDMWVLYPSADNFSSSSVCFLLLLFLSKREVEDLWCFFLSEYVRGPKTNSLPPQQRRGLPLPSSHQQKQQQLLISVGICCIWDMLPTPQKLPFLPTSICYRPHLVQSLLSLISSGWLQR